MSKTWAREATEWWDKRGRDLWLARKESEDEDTDPRSYNVIQRYGQERDTRRLEIPLEGDS